jgi:hypothetical protein
MFNKLVRASVEKRLAMVVLFRPILAPQKAALSSLHQTVELTSLLRGKMMMRGDSQKKLTTHRLVTRPGHHRLDSHGSCTAQMEQEPLSRAGRELFFVWTADVASAVAFSFLP